MKAYNKHSADDVMNSLEGMQPARLPEGLYARLEHRIAKGVQTIPLGRVSLAVACILLLVVLNVFMLSQQQTSSTPAQQDPMQSVAGYYGLTPNMETGL